jgi:tRNA(adenine34) deaminase
MGMNDSYWMAKALDLAIQARKENEVPVGAVIIDNQGQLLGSGYNHVLKNQDPTSHAEIIAIRNATATLKNYRLEGCSLFVTLEPCCMCAGALVHSRIKRLVFATRDIKAGAAGSVCNLLKGYPLNHEVIIDEGIMQKESAILLLDFFKTRR